MGELNEDSIIKQFPKLELYQFETVLAPVSEFLGETVRASRKSIFDQISKYLASRNVERKRYRELTLKARDLQYPDNKVAIIDRLKGFTNRDLIKVFGGPLLSGEFKTEINRIFSKFIGARADRLDLIRNAAGAKIFTSYAQLSNAAQQHYTGWMPMYHHVCTTVCSNQAEHVQYPLCDCYPIGERVARSMVRNAISRIFVNPYQSIMEPVVNGFDAYQTGAATSIGKFGMGFFSFLYWLIGHPERELTIITTNRHLSQVYQLDIREIAGTLAFQIRLQDPEGDIKGLAVHCPHSVFLFDPSDLVENPSFTNLHLTGSFTDSDVKMFQQQIDRLRFFERGQLYLNGQPVNASQQPKFCVSVEIDKSGIKIFDAGRGIAFYDILRALLVPAISTKTVKISKAVSAHRVTGITFLNKGQNFRFAVTVSGVGIVDFELTFDAIYGEFGATAESYFEQNFAPIEMRIDLPENTALPVARDDVILDDATAQVFGEQLNRLAQVVTRDYGDLTPLQTALSKYGEISAQKREVNLLVRHLHQAIVTKSFIDKAVYYIAPPAVQLLVDFAIQTRTVNRYVLVRDVTVDEDRLIHDNFNNSDIEVDRFAERKTVYVENYKTSVCHDFGCRHWIFVAQRYRDVKFNDLVRSNSEVYLSLASSVYERLKGGMIFVDTGHIKTASLVYGQLSDLINRFSAETNISDSKIFEFCERLFKNKFTKIGHLLALCLSHILARCRELMTTRHVTYGSQTPTKLAKAIQRLLEQQPMYGKYDLSLEQATVVLLRHATLDNIIDILEYKWLPHYCALAVEPTGFKIPMALAYLNMLVRASYSEVFSHTRAKTLLSEIGRVPPELIEYLETRVDASVLADQVMRIVTAQWRNRLDTGLIDAICDIIELSRDQPVLPVRDIKPPVYGTPVLLSRLIGAVFTMSQPPVTRDQYLKLIRTLVSSQATAKPSEKAWQIIELAVNAGTTKEATESAITETVQNSLDAIRQRGTGTGTITVQYGKTTNGEYFFQVEDDVGIPVKAIAALTIPYYSEKSSTSTLVTGEMGNGLFNIYRDAEYVEIDTLHPETGGFAIIDKPIREGRQVIDIAKTFAFESKRTSSGTRITVVLQDQPKFKLVFAHLGSYLSKLMTISEAQVSVNDVTSTEFYHDGVLLIDTNGQLSFDKPVGKNTLATAKFCRDPKFRSYLLTRGVPFTPLGSFVKAEFPDHDWLTSHLHQGLVINLNTGYTPVQSRTSLNLDKKIRDHLRLFIVEATFYYQLGRAVESLVQPRSATDVFLENFSSPADPNQIRFNVHSLAYSGRLSDFITYHRSALFEKPGLYIKDYSTSSGPTDYSGSLGKPSIAEMINMEISKFHVNASTYQPNIQIRPEIDPLVNKLIAGWFAGKKVDPPGDEVVVKPSSVVAVAKKPSGKVTVEAELKAVSSVLQRIFEQYIKIYCNLARSQVKIQGFYSENPGVSLVVERSTRSVAAHYSPHTVTIILTRPNSMANDLAEWKSMLDAIQRSRQDSNGRFRQFFANTQDRACTMDHELEHARNRDDCLGSAHGPRTITYGTIDPVTMDFDRVAIQTRTRMDRYGLTAKFLSAVRDILRGLHS